ncbi:3708_t:CDS:2, partial [Scutellospora calospora]
SDDQQLDQAKSNPTKDLDREMKIETDSSSIVTITSKLKENISNTEKAETISVLTKKKKENKRKLQTMESN